MQMIEELLSMTQAGIYPAPGAVLPAPDERSLELIQAALTSRSLARNYLHTARQFVGAARNARRAGTQDDCEAHLREARRAHEQARKCLRFVSLCQQRLRGSVALDILSRQRQV